MNESCRNEYPCVKFITLMGRVEQQEAMCIAKHKIANLTLKETAVINCLRKSPS